MREKRLEAYALYGALPMPHTTADDEWRRTVSMRTQDYWRRTRRYLRGFAVEKYHPNVLTTNGEVTAENIDYIEEETAAVLVQVDEQLQHISQAETLKEKGVEVRDHIGGCTQMTSNCPVTPYQAKSLLS